MHRPKYDDWTFPKGKVEPGETDEEAATREVREETGLECALGEEFATVRYVDSKGRPKQVRYWIMTVAGETTDVTSRDPERRGRRAALARARRREHTADLRPRPSPRGRLARADSERGNSTG